MRFIHTADLHLNVMLTHASFKNAKAHDIRLYELKDAFFRILSYAKETTVDALFIAGDLFDNASIKIHELSNIFERLESLPCKVFLLIGNHDAFLEDKTHQNLLKKKNIYTFYKETPSHEIDYETVVYGINTSDYSKAYLEELNQSLDKSKQNILMLHGDVFNPKDDHFLSQVKVLESTDFDYIALGHIHKHEYLRNHIVYAGNPEPLDFKETEKRGVIEGELKDNHLDTSFKPMQKRMFNVITLKITPKDTLDTIRQKISDAVSAPSKQKDFTRIILKGYRHESITIDTNKLRLYFEEDFHYLELKDETQLALDYDALKASYKDTLIDVLITNYKAKKSPKHSDKTALDEALIALLETEGRQ